jgi:excisionase family DNA binding protein
MARSNHLVRPRLDLVQTKCSTPQTTSSLPFRGDEVVGTRSEGGDFVPLMFGLTPEALELLAAKVAELIGLPQEPSNASPYMTVPEAAEYMRAKPQRCYDLLSAGRLTRYKDGSRVLLNRVEVDVYLAGGR